MHRLPTIVARGVYHLPFLGTGGEVYLVAVNRFGYRIFEATVLAGQDLPAAEETMRGLLDMHDPTPKLRLVS